MNRRGLLPKMIGAAVTLALLLACRAPASISAIFATPTPTPTPTPAATPTPSPTPLPTWTPTATSTPTPIPTPTVTPYPLPEGWRDHAVSGFYIALPERWTVVDVDEEGIEAVWSVLEGINTEWAQNATAMFSGEAMQEAMKFWAMDSEPAGAGYATAGVTYGTLPIPAQVDHLSTQTEFLYEQMGVEVVATETGLGINGLEAARLTVRLPTGPLAVKEYEYIYGRGREMWALTLGVDETAWSEYEPVFAAIAETFRAEEEVEPQ